MNVLIIGAGRMGIRHAQGAVKSAAVTSVLIADIAETALNNAVTAVNSEKLSTCLVNGLGNVPGPFDVCIIAATAGDRIGLLKTAEALQCKYIMVEKPLGQSMQQVEELDEYITAKGLDCAVNLNMRLYDSFIQLKNDLAAWPQMQGPKTITVNTGTLGIGANGIHYLDLVFFLLDADEAQVAAAEVDEQVIPSGRGAQFGDFGGWAAIKFFSKGQPAGTLLISMSATSTVFGGWEITGPNGRIYFNEVEQKRIDTLRDAHSTMPVNRYFADYLVPVESPIASPFLGDLTEKWIDGLAQGVNLLPNVHHSLKVHRLMFDWLSHSKTHKDIFPIT